MSYWFPSLPIYFAVGAIVFTQSDSTCGGVIADEIFRWILYFLAIVSGVLQIIIMTFNAYIEKTPIPERSLLRIIRDACFAESAATHKNIFKLPKEAYLPIVIQLSVYVYIYFINNSTYIETLLLILPIALIFIISLSKINLSYFALSIGIPGFISAFLYGFSIFNDQVEYIVYIYLFFYEAVALVVCFLIKFIKRFMKLRKDISDPVSWSLLGPVFARRIGVILLQAILAILIFFTVNALSIPLPLGIIFALVTGELVVILSNLKMRYWFPSLPIYLAYGAAYMSFSPSYADWTAICIALAAFQMLFMFFASLTDDMMKHEKTILKKIYKACFEKTESHPNLFKLSEKACWPIIIQLVLYVSILIVRDTSFYLIYLLLLLIAFPFIAKFLKLNLKYWIFSLGVFAFLIAFGEHYFESSTDIIDIIVISFIQLFVISGCFVIRFIVKLKKSLTGPKTPPGARKNEFDASTQGFSEQ
jgi:hypothetical protein